MQRYLGNKTKLLKEIDVFIQDNKIEGKSFFDIFAGTGAVSRYFKAKYKVYSNDILYFSYVIQKAILSFDNEPSFKKFVKLFQKDPIVYLNELKPLKQGFFFKNFSEKSKCLYYSDDNAKRIDTIRYEIDKLFNNKIISKNEWYYLLACLITEVNSRGNTCGTFGAFIKRPSKSFYKPLQIKSLDVGKGSPGKAYNKDYLIMLKKIKADIIYADPPYTAVDYSQAYHLLETLSLNDNPKLKGKTKRREQTILTSNFVKKSHALQAFVDLFEATNTENLIISYSTHGIVKISDLIKTLKKYYKKVVVKSIKYQKYITALGNEKGDLSELLILGKGRING